MVVMDKYRAPDRLTDLWQAIDDLHLGYLQMEESPEKLDLKQKLEDYIKDYLFLASHAEKFTFRETAEVLHRSASTKRDFSGYKAASGFNAIQLYAGNLVSQPWRTEYQQIKTYSGFYKHQIEANLVDAELIFKAMGYRPSDIGGILQLEGPVCPDRVINISKDCLIAYVECQILKGIWEEVSPKIKVTWLEVLKLREMYRSDIDQVSQTLIYDYQHPKEHQRQNSFGEGSYHHHHQHRNNHHPYKEQDIATTSAYGHHGNNKHQPTVIYVPYPNPYPPYSSIPPPPPPTMSTNGYYYLPHPVAPPPMYGYDNTVPTAQLVEVGSPSYYHHHQPSGLTNGAVYDTVDGGARQGESSQVVDKTHDTINRNNNHSTDSKSEDNWDYVYQKLESKGYSKDLGERGDVLNNKAKAKVTNLDLEAAMKGLALNNIDPSDLDKSNKRPLKFPDALKKLTDTEESQKASATLGKKRVQQAQPQQLNGTTKWQCSSCTYLNDGLRDICEICSKSRVNVDQEMEVGGPECSKCTLVNARDSKMCQACGNSLKDSPTYI